MISRSTTHQRDIKNIWKTDADLTEGQGSDILRTGDIARRLPDGMFEIVERRSRFVKLFRLRIGLDEVEKHLHGAGLAWAVALAGGVLIRHLWDPLEQKSLNLNQNSLPLNQHPADFKREF